MSGELRLLNRQRARPVDLRRLRAIVRNLLREQLQLENFDLTIHLVNSVTMARLNETHL
jgi:ssRNA-specific RNase YbeY (16S rRNA maturation enzyme)